MAERKVLVKSGPLKWPRDPLPEAELIRHLDALIELKPGRQPANQFILLISPHRNGNTSFMRSVLPKIGAGRAVSKLAVEQSEGLWNSEQYPRIVHALFPRYRSSAHERETLRRRFAPLGVRLQYYAIDLLLPAIAFLGMEILMAYGLGDFSTPPTTVTVFLQKVGQIPAWSHLLGIAAGVAIDLLHRKRDALRSRFRFGDPATPGYELTDADRALLCGSVGAYGPLLEQLGRALDGPSVLWVDRADGLDELSAEVLTRFLEIGPTPEGEAGKPRQASNRVVVLHFADRKSPLYLQVCLELAKYVDPEERLAQVELQPVPLEERKRIAAELGKTEDDAVVASLIANLMELDEPRVATLRQAWRDLLESDLARPPADSCPSLLFILMATAGVDGPKQFGQQELRGMLTPQEGTFGRWAKVYGRKAWYPNPLWLDLLLLQQKELSLVERRESLGNKKDSQLVVPPEIRRVVLGDLDTERGWARGAHAFWAAYAGDRFETDKSDLLTKVVELSYHLLRIRFPAPEEIANREAAQALGRSLLFAAVRTIRGLIELAQFDRAHAVLLRIQEEVLPSEDVWSSEECVRQVEYLSEEAWRLATVRGASREILAFQKLLGDRGGRSAAKGIEVSVAIYDLYSRAVNLEELDREQGLSLRIAGGDEATRARLENLRRYALNLSLLRRNVLVLESLELFDVDAVAAEIRPQLLDPVPSPRLDFFELLLGFQSARAYLALNDLEAGARILRQTAESLVTAVGKRGRYDLFEEAVWLLCVAEGRLVALDALVRHGPLLAGLHEDFREVLSLLFQVGQERPDLEALGSEVADSLEDAHLIQELCELSFGRAYLMNARVRCARILGGRQTRHLEAWENGAQIAKNLACRHLQMGTLLVRSQVRQDVETCVSCLKIVCEESLRQGLEAPLDILGNLFADLVLKLKNLELYRIASEILKFKLDHSVLKPDDPVGLARRCRVGALYAQFLRLLGDPKTALAGLADGLALDPANLPKEARELARDSLLSARLQACWCYEALGDDAGLASTLSGTLSLEGCDRWSGYAYLVRLRFRRELKTGRTPQEAIRDALRAFAPQGWKTSYEQRGLLSLASDLLRTCLEDEISGQTRHRVVDVVTQLIERLSEWVGIETAIEFLSLALQLEELDDPQLKALYESFVAREALMSQRLMELDHQLGGGRPEPLLEYILRRFSHRIVLLDEPGNPGRQILEQLDKGAAVTQDQVARALARVGSVQPLEGGIGIDPSVLALLRLPNGGEVPLPPEVGAALWSATEQILHAIASADYVHPKLADAMRTYLRIAEAFSKV